MRLPHTLKPSYSYRDNKKIDEKKQNKRSAFFVFSQMSTFNNLLKMHKLLNVDILNVCE